MARLNPSELVLRYLFVVMISLMLLVHFVSQRNGEVAIEPAPTGSEGAQCMDARNIGLV